MLPPCLHQLSGHATIEPAIDGGGGLAEGKQQPAVWRPNRLQREQCEQCNNTFHNDGLDPREPALLTGGKCTNPTPIPSEVIAIMKGLCTQRPDVDMNALMRSEKIRIAEIGI